MKKMVIFVVFFLGMCFSGYSAGKINSNNGKPNKVPDEIIVKFDKNITDAKKDYLKGKYGMKLKKNSKKAGAFTVYKHGNPAAIMNKLKNEPGVISVEQNAYAYMSSIPNDTYFSPYQWHLSRIDCESAWDVTSGNGVVVAIIDTGVKQTLEDLAGTNFTAGYDFVNNDNDPTDDEGHGSHVCGTVAQTTNNNLGCAGVAYNCTIMPIKVLDSRGSGSFDDIADGIIWAVDNGCDIINMSLGGTSSLTILEDAVNYAWNNGVVVVCAAGNEDSSAPSYPGAYTNSISVTATAGNDDRASYSNYGTTVDIAAPGGDTGDYNGDGYDDMILQNTFSGTSEGYYFFAGTSMASPHVAGVAALVKSVNPSLTNAEIRNILESTAEDLGDPGWDQYYGNGLVDAFAAVNAAGGGTPTNNPPTSDFTYTTTDLKANFTDNSYDSDGSVVAYSWNFGDGATSSVQNPSHTYLSAGTYNVTLTVTDNEGATDASSKSVTVTAPPTGNDYVYVDNIVMSMTKRGRNYIAYGTVYIYDNNGNPVSGATVYADWSGAATSSVSGVTGSDGSYKFTSPKTKISGPYIITVTDVSATLPYDSSANNETSDSISY